MQPRTNRARRKPRSSTISDNRCWIKDIVAVAREMKLRLARVMGSTVFRSDRAAQRAQPRHASRCRALHYEIAGDGESWHGVDDQRLVWRFSFQFVLGRFLCPSRLKTASAASSAEMPKRKTVPPAGSTTSIRQSGWLGRLLAM